jgi:hypothetical protein
LKKESDDEFHRPVRREKEVETVRRIFTSFVSEGKYLGEIAAELNAERVRTTRGLRWNGIIAGKIIANEAYVGSLIFNRSSYKLKQCRVENPRGHVDQTR